MNILFTLCGRAGSKGIKNKNIMNFLDKPLVYYSISAIDLFVKNQQFIKDLNYDIALNTDSKELIELVLNNKMQNVELVDRKQELAGDIVGKKFVVADTCFEMMKKKNIKYDVIVDLDITSPLRTEKDLENLIRKFIESNVDVVFSVTESRRNPYFNMVCRRDGVMKKVIESNFTSRQQAPEVYDMNASLYAYSYAFLKTNGNVLDGKSEIIVMKDTVVLDLDRPEDIEYMSLIAEYIFKVNRRYGEIYDNIR